jgi:hypothetical protein
MRTLILLPVLLFLLASCNRYQYLTVASDDLATNRKNEFVMETDTLVITYNFHGYKGPVQISIQNKSKEAIQIDWKRSSLIIGDNPVNYFNPEMQIRATVENERPLFNNRQYNTKSRLRGTITSQEGMEFIPPGSVITNADLYLAEELIDTSAKGLRTEKIRSAGMYMKVKRGNFSRLTSPVPFRSYLTFITAGTESRTFIVDHSFYISQLIDSYQQPRPDWLKDEEKGNEFYIKKGNKGAGNTALVLGGIGAAAIFVTVASQQL